MITLKFPIQLSEEDVEFVLTQQRIQSSMIRSAYKTAELGLAEISVREKLRTQFGTQMDSWYLQSAVKSGMGMFKADNELGVFHRIFGGKKTFIRRQKGLITNDEWKMARLLPLYLIGESPQKGNRKFDFSVDTITFKPHKGKRILIYLPRMKKNWDKKWSRAVQLAHEKLIPITVSLTTTHIHLSFDDANLKDSKKSVSMPISTRYAGIDLNPNYIGVSIFDGTRLMDTKLFSLKELTGKRACSDKLEHETREIGHSIGKWLKCNQVSKLFIEHLSLKQGDKGLGKGFNRLTQNQWKKTNPKEGIGKIFQIIRN